MNLENLRLNVQRALFSRKQPADLWSSPFENALVGFVLSRQKERPESELRRVLIWIERWFRKCSLQADVDIAAAGLYSAILAMEGQLTEAKEIGSKVCKALTRLKEKKDWKFGFFNKAELLYSALTGVVYSRCIEEQEGLKKYVTDILEKQSRTNWGNDCFRMAFFSATRCLLEGDLKNYLENLKRSISALNLEALREDEVISLLWFLEVFGDKIKKSIEDARPFKEARDTLLRRLLASSDSFIFDVDSGLYEDEPETELGRAGHLLSALELCLLVDVSSAFSGVQPSTIYDLLQLHPRIQDASEKLFKDSYYPQAVFEAFKTLIILVKEKSGRQDLDGKDLMAKVFSKEKPILAFNELKTEYQKNVQEGFRFLFMGATTAIRNPPAHERITRMDPFEALEYLNFASLLARKVEASTKM